MPGGKIVTVAGATFTISTNSEADTRRRAYFSSGAGSLARDELNLLKHLGIDAKQSPLKQMLAEFFMTLPDCQSDASLYTKVRCELPYRVLWQSMWLKRTPSDSKVPRLGSFALGELDRVVEVAPFLRTVGILEQLLAPSTYSGLSKRSKSALDSLATITNS